MVIASPWIMADATVVSAFRSISIHSSLPSDAGHHAVSPSSCDCADWHELSERHEEYERWLSSGLRYDDEGVDGGDGEEGGAGGGSGGEVDCEQMESSQVQGPPAHGPCGF